MIFESIIYISFAGYGGSQYQQPYPQQPSVPPSGGMYPNMQGPPNYGVSDDSSFSYSFRSIFVFSQGGAPPSAYQQPGFPPQEQSSIFLASLEQYQGTVFPAANFNPEADCQALSHAMKGAGKSNFYKF